MEQTSNTKKVIKGISSQTIVTMASGIEGIVYFSIMSRLLSREDFGFYAAISAVTVIFNSISDAGIGTALIQRKEMTEDYKNTAFTLSVIISSFVALVLVAMSGLLARLVVGEHLKYPLMIMASTIFFNGLISVNLSWMRRHLHFLRSGIIMLVSHVVSSVLAIYLAWKGYGFIAIIFKVVSASFFILIISYFYVYTKFRFVLKREYVKSILNFGGWLTASVVINNISSQIDRLLMSRLISVEALGAYNRPKEFILRIGSRINGIFDTALFPVLSGIQDNNEKLRNAFNRSQYSMNLSSMALTLVFICNSELLIRLFFGEEWMDLKPLFQIISLSLLFNINGRLGDCYLRSLGLVRQQFNLRSFELVLGIVCVMIGFRYGILGVAVGFLLANIILITIKTLYLARRLQIPNSEIIQNVIGGWAYGLYFIPLIVIQYIILPNTWFMNILSACVFLLFLGILFLVYPNLIGKHYQEEIYCKIKFVIINSFHKKLYG